MPSGSFIPQTRPNEIQKSQRRAVPLQHCSSVKDCVAKHLMETHTEIEATERQDVGIGSRVCGSCDPAMRFSTQQELHKYVAKICSNSIQGCQHKLLNMM